ncbi:GNAT family N-acetyltransferase [Demequina globuliformis]|uniref:GNAT family N-acetyltransferase n=1 Tax=Demequina globuliformis TaxID=676202 RepID=UPI00078145A4|nr:GNAT family protein [Demequina globuliformis]
MQVLLRPLAMQDVPELSKLLTLQANYLQPWEPERAPSYFTEDGQRELARTAIAAREAGTRAPFVICSDSGAIVGVLNLSGIVRGALQSCALGYWVRSELTGRGYATSAVAQAVDFAFDELHLHRVQAETLPENIASQRVLAHNGFRQYGMAPEYLSIAGRWRDHLMFQKISPHAR